MHLHVLGSSSSVQRIDVNAYLTSVILGTIITQQGFIIPNFEFLSIGHGYWRRKTVKQKFRRVNIYTLDLIRVFYTLAILSVFC